MLGHAEFGDQASPFLTRVMINAFCFYFGDDSWSRHAGGFFSSWQKQEAVRIISWNEPGNEGDSAIAPLYTPPSTTDPGIGLGPIELMPSVIGSRRIAYVVWETTTMPSDKVAILRTMDEVWTPSSWGRQLLIDNGIDADKVGVVPEGVDVESFKPDTMRDGKPRPFRFLCVGKWEERKGTEDLINAFCDSFRAEEPVELVLHCFNRYLPGFDLENSIRRRLRGNAPAIIASHPTGQAGMIRLYNSCDAFVLPTRAEGWGLPITEAMACGLPVIVTEYSAPLDYLNRDFAYLIPVEKLVPAHDPNFFPANGLGEWAKPDFQSLRKLMRHVFENPAEAKEKGSRARAEVCRQWTWELAATKARHLLSRSS
jgi:glycosyltransferase involved in cell wall biosynthesis